MFTTKYFFNLHMENVRKHAFFYNWLLMQIDKERFMALMIKFKFYLCGLKFRFYFKTLYLVGLRETVVLNPYFLLLFLCNL